MAGMILKRIFEFTESSKNVHGQLLRYEFYFEAYNDKYYDGAVFILIRRIDFPAEWRHGLNIKDGSIQYLSGWPSMSNEAKDYMDRVYKLKMFW